MPTRIAVFAFDFPFPANRGGRADIWRRLQGFKQLGCDVMLVTWYQVTNGPPTAEQLAAVQGVVSLVKLYPSRTGLMDAITRLATLPRRPSHVASKRLDATQRADVDRAVDQFKPELVWCEGPYPGLEASRVARRQRIPYIYRSHNIEYLYMARQASAARRLRDQLLWRVACIGLKRFERTMIQGAKWVFDISCDDMAFWQREGVRNISWLPPLAEAAMQLTPSRMADAPEIGDVVFLGNLVTPNNIRGVEWLITEIAPIVLKRRPETSFVIAGSNPGEYVTKLCQAPGVTLIPNPADALAVYRGGRVLVNPVRTGSGTHVKAIEMLMTHAPIVTATQGTCGLPDEVKRLFLVADTAQAFADQILSALAKPENHATERVQACRLFRVDGLADALAGLPHQDTTLPPEPESVHVMRTKPTTR